MKIVVTTPEAQKGFYPTPPDVAEKLLEGIKWHKVKNVLEPSAGTGNLVEAMAYSASRDSWRHSSQRLEVDCIELDPSLRSILTAKFSVVRETDTNERVRVLGRMTKYDYDQHKEVSTRTEAEETEYLHLCNLKAILGAVTVRSVHDDFLTFNSRKSYDLIVMNPPFADGDKHLLKAISLVEPYGGEIRCILNAETLRNPFSNYRRLLAQKLGDLGAEVTFFESAFANADRATNVEIAIVKIKVSIPKYEEDPNSIYNRLKAAATVEEDDEYEATELTVADRLKAIVRQYNYEVDAGLTLIREYKAMQPYLLDSLDKENKYSKPILSLTLNNANTRGEIPVVTVNGFLKAVRHKYWTALFTKKEFVGKLTSNLQEKYRKMVDDLANYDFSLFNIQRIMAEMNAEMSKGVVDTILALFQRMTVDHTYYPECSRNIHYFNGWCTNKAHKIGKKVILPESAFNTWFRESTFDPRSAKRILEDIEKALNYLDGNMTAPVDLEGVLNAAHKARIYKDLKCKFFTCTFYKKGTVHITFTCPELIERFNIFCAQNKGWLPPCYGRKNYKDLTTEEQAVMDSFHGNDKPGSGEKAYTEVMARANYYLAPPNSQRVALPGMSA